jgi:transglutaminase-like putative cysteine protease
VRTGSCGHKATLFAAIMRASGIPARVRVGRWAGLGGEANPLNVHVKCDFWAQNIGWVNVEFGEPAHPDNPQGAFGTDADFITYHLEVNLELKVWGKPRPAHILQWADILPLGDFKHEGQSSSSRSTVETLWSRETTGQESGHAVKHP